MKTNPPHRNDKINPVKAEVLDIGPIVFSITLSVPFLHIVALTKTPELLRNTSIDFLYFSTALSDLINLLPALVNLIVLGASSTAKTAELKSNEGSIITTHCITRLSTGFILVLFLLLPLDKLWKLMMFSFPKFRE
jgi:hypothetical protein